MSVTAILTFLLSRHLAMRSIQSLLSDLVQYQSVTPNDAGCQDYLIQRLEALGFDCQRFDHPPVANFFARLGTNKPLLVFAGHTDVVPIGDATKWQTHPFELHEKNGMLYGRGVADMKGSLAAMLISAERFIKNNPDYSGSLGFLITSGEEGDDYHLGTPWVMEQLTQQGIKLDYCIVGEPSSSHRLADTLKIGRRGSLNAQITVHGKQGHVAYPHLAHNAIHMISPVLTELTQKQWDQGNAHFPPTSLQITHLQAGGFANNVIPGELHLQLNIRYSTEQTASSLKQAIEACFERHHLNPDINWRLSGEPFLTDKGALLETCSRVIENHTGVLPDLSTSGGTSDGRFIAPFGVEVVELGPINATIHQVNECVALADLEQLADLYYDISVLLLAEK